MPQPATYSDGKTRAMSGDHVHGIGPNGHAVAGQVDSVNQATGQVRVLPYVLDAMWCNASDCSSTTGQPKGKA